MVIIQVLLATLAAIIASQSLITGSFTLVSEAIKLNLFPKLVIKYPTDIRGQVYVSAVNIILFIFSSSVVVFFRTSSNMEAAYGLSISITMFVTTILLSLYLYKIKNQKIMALIFFIVFGLEESLFLYANSLKFISGGYITVVIAILIFGIMFIWYRGVEIKERESQYLLVEKYKKQYKKYDKILAICDTMRDEFIEILGMDTNKVELVYNPINLEIIQKNQKM